ncbi:MAG: hypothetical protein JNL98_20335 [Bryobacterales bacterium]|nr:hypothetical protein [Bryobacterales bacterium]
MGVAHRILEGLMFGSITESLDIEDWIAERLPSGPRVRIRAAEVEADIWAGLPTTYYKRMPPPWKGYVAVRVLAAATELTPVQFSGSPLTKPLTLKLKRWGSAEGNRKYGEPARIGFIITVNYNVVHPGTEPVYEKQGKDQMILFWEYTVYTNGDIQFREPTFLHYNRSDEAHWDYSAKPIPASPITVPSNVANLQLQFKMTTGAFQQSSGSRTDSDTIGISHGVEAGSNRTRNSPTLNPPIPNYSPDDLLLKIIVEPIDPDPPKPPTPAPRVPDKLVVYFANETDVVVSPAWVAKIHEWVTGLQKDKPWLWTLLEQKKVKITVRGYASMTGPPAANWETYSDQRAKNVKAIALKAAGEMERGKDYINVYAKGHGVTGKPGPDPEARRAEVSIEQSEVDAIYR